MKYYLIAGEASGDLHASNLVKELKKEDNSAIFKGWGGDLMQQQGVEIVKHYRDLAFMGFLEVIANLRTILKNISICKKDVLAFKPDVLILVDYPGFNLRIAEFAKQNNIPVVYYISPQVWAWKESRVHKIKKIVDEMLVILPFEQSFYQKYDYKVYFCGHPLLDALDTPDYKHDSFKRENNLPDKPLIALMPGSRKQEISVMLPLMCEAADHFKDYQFVIAGAPSQDKEFYESFGLNNIPVVLNKTYELLSNAHAALVTSGTATLETALFDVPQVVCYKGGKVSYLIARMLIKVKYISLVNLVMDKPIVKELIQDDLTVNNIVKELKKVIDGDGRRQMLADYNDLKLKLGGTGASKRAARRIIERFKK